MLYHDKSDRAWASFSQFSFSIQRGTETSQELWGLGHKLDQLTLTLDSNIYKRQKGEIQGKGQSHSWGTAVKPRGWEDSATGRAKSN